LGRLYGGLLLLAGSDGDAGHNPDKRRGFGRYLINPRVDGGKLECPVRDARGFANFAARSIEQLDPGSYDTGALGVQDSTVDCSGVRARDRAEDEKVKGDL